MQNWRPVRRHEEWTAAMAPVEHGVREAIEDARAYPTYDDDDLASQTTHAALDSRSEVRWRHDMREMQVSHHKVIMQAGRQADATRLTRPEHRSTQKLQNGRTESLERPLAAGAYITPVASPSHDFGSDASPRRVVREREATSRKLEGLPSPLGLPVRSSGLFQKPSPPVLQPVPRSPNISGVPRDGDVIRPIPISPGSPRRSTYSNTGESDLYAPPLSRAGATTVELGSRWSSDTVRTCPSIECDDNLTTVSSI